ncbi:MAG: DUF1987 domain-containing protein [Bacteroidetes bacterium]|nr:DUF1987 domain-containing protein [Bacteroidota bacterium]
MDALIIPATERLPSVSLVAETGKLIFSGRALPEDGREFFTPILRWMVSYALQPAALTECSFQMEYFNSSSRKCFTDVFDILDSMREKGHAVMIIWYFEEADDEMKEMGEHYESLYDLDFQFRSC